jgi:hypothetical protein
MPSLLNEVLGVELSRFFITGVLFVMGMDGL